LVYVLFDCGNGLEKHKPCQLLSGKFPVHFADFWNQDGDCRHHETIPAGRKTVSRNQEMIPSVVQTVPDVWKTLRHFWNSFPDMWKPFRQASKPIPEVTKHPVKSGNAFMTRKNHYLMPATRSGKSGKHFVMLGNGFLTQKAPPRLGNGGSV
jgi:hypothetical protein